MKISSSCTCPIKRFDKSLFSSRSSMQTISHQNVCGKLHKIPNFGCVPPKAVHRIFKCWLKGAPTRAHSCKRQRTYKSACPSFHCRPMKNYVSKPYNTLIRRILLRKKLFSFTRRLDRMSPTKLMSTCAQASNQCGLSHVRFPVSCKLLTTLCAIRRCALTKRCMCTAAYPKKIRSKWICWRIPGTNLQV